MKLAGWITVVLLTLLVGVGCSSINDVSSARGTGSVRIYDRSFDTVWDAVIAELESQDLELVSEDRERGEILAQQGITAFSYGEKIAVFIKSAGGNNPGTRVEIVSKAALSANLLATDWESELLDALDQQLRRGRRG